MSVEGLLTAVDQQVRGSSLEAQIIPPWGKKSACDGNKQTLRLESF